MKTYPLILEDSMHDAIKNSAQNLGESIKDFIMKSVKARLSIADYIKTNKKLQEKIKNRKNTNFIEVKSIEEIF